MLNQGPSQQTNIFSTPVKEDRFSYYEYKYLVKHDNLTRVRSILDELYGSSDPYPCGIVDSIYYDTLDEKLLEQCTNGDSGKVKFRIRGYQDGNYQQIHQKIKELSSVGKLKDKIRPVQMTKEHAPSWEEIAPLAPSTSFDQIQYNMRKFGMMYPSVRVKYFRYRYRSYDFRMTLDTNIEVFSPINGIPKPISYATIPHHVLEIKTRKERPNLPFVGLIKLPQVSFSKFMLGLSILNLEPSL